MKNKKNSVLTVAILIAIVCLGIGYAAATTTTLTINGTATAKQNTDFKVYFTKAEADTTQVTTGEDEKSSTAKLVDADEEGHSLVAEMTATIKKVGSTQTATFTVENGSAEGLAAKISSSKVYICTSADCTSSNYTSDYFDVTTSLTSDVTIASKKSTDSAFKTTDFTVTVKLKKAAVTEDVTENFFVVLKDIEAVED